MKTLQELDFSTVFHAMPVPFLVLKADQTIIFASDVYLDVTHTTNEQLLGKNVFDVFPDNSATGLKGAKFLKQSLQKVLKTQETDTLGIVYYEVWNPDLKKFEERYWSTVNSPIIRNGEVTHIIHKVEEVTDVIKGAEKISNLEIKIASQAAQIRDVNTRLRQEKDNLEHRVEERTEELSQSTEQLAFIANAIPIHLNQYDAQERFIFVNKATQEWWGISEKDFVGKTLQEVLGDEKYEDFRPYLERVFKGESVTQETFIQSPSGQSYYFLNKYVPHFNSRGVVDSFINLGIDITEQVMAREKLIAQAKILETEKDLRERFVSALTHDLRTPLTAAKISAQLLSRKLSEDPGSQKFAIRISDNIDRADIMIRDLLDANLVKAGEKLPVKIVPCNLDHVIQEVIEELSTLHGDRFLYKKQGPVDGYWDCEALRRITENLLNNAIKYGSSVAPITINLKEAHGRATLSVHNMGSYITPKDQESLFEQFKRTEEAQKGDQRGWGIGLSLVKGLVEAHHGSIKVESDNQTGTTFIVELPVDARPEAVPLLNKH